MDVDTVQSFCSWQNENWVCRHWFHLCRVHIIQDGGPKWKHKRQLINLRFGHPYNFLVVMDNQIAVNYGSLNMSLKISFFLVLLFVVVMSFLSLMWFNIEFTGMMSKSNFRSSDLRYEWKCFLTDQWIPCICLHGCHTGVSKLQLLLPSKCVLKYWLIFPQGKMQKTMKNGRPTPEINCL